VKSLIAKSPFANSKSPEPRIVVAFEIIFRLPACLACGFAAVMVAGLAGCDSAGMEDQPRYEPLEASDFFKDGMSSRPLVAGTVARGELSESELLTTGRIRGELVRALPVKLDRSLVVRGRERFNIYCAVCHDPTGSGDGMIPRRGFRRPPSYHIDRLRSAPPGHFFDVITNGFGVMPRFAPQIEPRDRWAIVAYIRALQLSQSASVSDLPRDVRAQLLEARP